MSRSPAAACELRVVDSVDIVGSRAWTELARACDAPVFYGYDFLRSVETLPLTYPSKAYYLLATGPDGRLIAALPVYLQQTRDPFSGQAGEAAAVRALVGHVWHCYDTMLLSRVPLSAWLVERFWAALAGLAAEHRAELWGLANIALGEPLARQLEIIGIELEKTVPRYRLPLRPHGPATLDEHLAAVGRASRRTLRQYCRRAARAGASITLRPGHEALGQDVLGQDVLGLCLKTADKHAPGYYPPQRLAALIRRLGSACRILRIELDGTLLAASICLYDRTRMHAWAGGCEYPAGLNWSPQYVLFAAELEAGLATGLAMMECGRRNDEFKARYGLQPYPLARAICRA